MEEIVVHATRDQIEEFKESLLWADIQRELKAWQAGFQGELGSIAEEAADTNPSTASVLIHLGSVDGRIKATNYMLGILDIFLQILEDKKDDSEHK